MLRQLVSHTVSRLNSELGKGCTVTSATKHFQLVHLSISEAGTPSLRCLSTYQRHASTRPRQLDPASPGGFITPSWTSAQDDFPRGQTRGVSRLLSPREKLAEVQGSARRAVDDTLAKPRAAAAQAQAHLAAALAAPARARARASQLRQQVSLEVEKQWHKNFIPIVGVSGVAASLVLWRALTSMAAAVSYHPTDYSLLALASMVVGATAIGVREAASLKPDDVLQRTLYVLQTNPGTAEVLGLPIRSAGPQACVVSGGGLKFRGWQPHWASKRLHMAFPVAGAEYSGVCSVHAVKFKWRTTLDLVAVDVLTKSGADQRIYAAGDTSAYERGEVVTALRGPLEAVRAIQPGYAAEDLAAEARLQAAAAAKAPKPLAQGGGMYTWEKIHTTMLTLPQRIKAFVQSNLPR